MQARKWVLTKRFEGAPKLSDFKLEEETISENINDGEILCKAEWLTVDPYMRGLANRLPVGTTMAGAQVARVIKSRNPEFPEGSQVVAQFGWRNLTVYKPGPPTTRGYDSIHKMVEMKGLPDSYALGSVGMPGNTAYFGLLRLCEPKAGDVLVVSAAAGAVGSIVGQIGKLKGCTVLGFAGTDDKLQWMKNELGFDHVFNYKTVDLNETFKTYAPNGIDCYFDNVGGEFTYQVMRNMKLFGRIALCGAITAYNNDPTKPTMVPFDYNTMIYNQVKMEGFMVLRWKKEWFEGLKQLRDWIKEGKIKVQETRVDGFDQMPQAFIDLLGGKNTGKMVIKA